MTAALDRFTRVMWMAPDGVDDWHKQDVLTRHEFTNGIRAALLDMAENPSEEMVEAMHMPVERQETWTQYVTRQLQAALRAAAGEG